MNREYDAIVVGAGMAGLTSAAYLSRQGLKTLVCEKGNKTGGLINTFWHQDFAFDAGIRAFENSGIILPMLKNLGLDLELTENIVSVGIENKWTKVDTPESLETYVSMLTSIFPDQAADIDNIAQEIQKVLGYMDVLYGIDNPLFMENMKDLNYLGKTLLPWMFKYLFNIRKAIRLDEPVNDYLRKFTKNESLIDMISQHFFKQTPTFFALSYYSLYLDYFYPAGGTGVLADKMTDFIRAKNGQILTETAVTQIDAHQRTVELDTGESLLYKKLIWAADQKTLYEITNGPETTAIAGQRLLNKQSIGGDSVFTLFIGEDQDRDYFASRSGAHAFYTPQTEGLSSMPDWKPVAEQGLEALYDWVGAYLQKTTYEISCPALRDPALAPAGKTGVIISTLLDYWLVRHFSELGEYEALKRYCVNKITAVLTASLFPNFSDNILFALSASPLTIERETGNAEGAITGWAFTNDSMPAENRFTKIANSINTPFENIYKCGQWTFSPSGLPVSILTGKLAADAVLKSLKGR